ncbi:MAG: response regulator transcription factor [Acidobacteriota bacterium]|jgi:two-component system alkaline phosphatase synthesis response regulator PhoP
MNQRILLVEDERGLIRTLSDCLTGEGYIVETALDGETGARMASEQNFDLLVLDVMLPKKNGFDLLRDLRQQGIGTPAIMLTARGQVIDKILGLKLGADDYLTKPFDMGELLARIEAILRRAIPADQPTPETFTFGDVRIDFRRAEVTRAGQPVDLAAREYNLLRYFIENREKVLSRDKLLDEVWGYDAMPVTRTVDVHVGLLRQKLEPNPRQPQYFLTVHGLGYKFVG